jgi:group II intron reverse transcriptase/maturase
MYVAPQVDKTWLSNVQRRLYSRSWETPDYVFCKLWGLITDPRNLRTAFARVAKNRGHRTGGVDRITVRMVIIDGAEPFIDGIRAELRSGIYRPNPVRRVLIPKAGHPGKFRPLGIPTVKDRVVQAAMKNILEPIFEADFFPSSYGFRPGRSAHAALEHLRELLVPKKITPTETRLPYQWAIEGDIKACFDQIDHHGLMVRARRRIGDPKTNRLILAFLKAGVLTEGQLLRSDVGTPQGGILSPLLANIALGVIDERYERHVWPRSSPTRLTQAEAIRKRASNARSFDRNSKPVMFPVRYADGMPEEALDVRVKVPSPQLPVQGSSSEAACAGDRTGQVPRHRPRQVAAEQQAVTKVNPLCSLVILRSGGRPSRRKGKAVRSREAMGTCTAMAPSGRQGRHVAKVQLLESGRSGRTIEEVAPVADVYKADRRSDVGVRPEVGGARITRADEDSITAPMVKLVGGTQTMMRREDFTRGRGPAFINALEAASEL